MINHGNYARRFLADCYASMRRMDEVDEKVTLWIVDHGSTQASRDFIRRTAPGARIIQSSVNSGWAAGANRAVREASREGCDYFWFVNMDTEWDAGALAELMRAARRYDEYPIFQPLIYLHGRNALNSVGNRIHYLGYGYCEGYGKSISDCPAWPKEGLREINFASGSCMLVRGELFEKIGGFREEFFLYYEDLEFCLRAAIAGRKTALVHGSVCHHKYEFNTKLRWLYYLERNRLLTLLTLYQKRTLLFILPMACLVQAVSAAYFTCKGHGKVQWNLLKYFLKKSTWSMILRYRGQITGIRRVSDRDLLARFSSEIVFAEIKSATFKYLARPAIWLYGTLLKRML